MWTERLNGLSRSRRADRGGLGYGRNRCRTGDLRAQVSTKTRSTLGSTLPTINVPHSDSSKPPLTETGSPPGWPTTESFDIVALDSNGTELARTSID
jgi:hypothetical protein